MKRKSLIWTVGEEVVTLSEAADGNLSLAIGDSTSHFGIVVLTPDVCEEISQALASRHQLYRHPSTAEKEWEETNKRLLEEAEKGHLAPDHAGPAF